MREIKFRAWDEQSEVMHYNFEWVSSGSKGNDWIIFKSNIQKLSSKPHPFENPYFRQQYHIMQYTGLKDKNGKEIYEGDVVKYKGEKCNTCGHIMGDKHDEMYQILWHKSSCEFICTEINGDNWLDACVWCFCEIIGNIYGNPELLNDPQIR